MRVSLILCTLALHGAVRAQNVAINATGAAPAASAMLDITSTTTGVLVPRLALTATNATAPVTTPATSLLVYNTATAGTAPNDVTPGYYYWDGVQWVRFAATADSWRVTGNAGTVAGTNFIGTTDAVDWVIKTGGNAAANERMRVRSTGQVVQNNTAHFAGDAFSVYGNNTTNGTTNSINNTVGTFAVNGYAAGNGTGVYGETAGGATTAGTAIWGDLNGTATTASTTTEGVYGSNTTAPAGTGATAAAASGVRGEAVGAAGTAFTMGVLGISTSTTGSAFGVYGQGSSTTAPGTFGVNTDVSTSAAHGVQGQSGALSGGAGVRGFHTAAAFAGGQFGYGVRGTSAGIPTGTGFVIAVRGDATSTTGQAYGLYGSSASPTGFAIGGVSTAANGTGLLVTGNNLPNGTYLTNGTGLASNGTLIGVYGLGRNAAGSIGVLGVGNAVANLTPAQGAGVVGAGAQFGVVGYATLFNGTDPLLNQAAAGAAASSGGYFEVQSGGTAQTWAYVGVRDNTATLRKIIGPGTVNTVVRDLNGERVALSCPEAPENLFQDFGTGQLVDGQAHISIDPVFAKNIVVNASHPLRVFVQPEGDCAGVFVANKTNAGFDVIELAGGSSSTSFSYMITANRADEVNPDGTIARYSAERFPAAPGPLKSSALASVTTNDGALRKDLDEAPIHVPPLAPKKRRVRD